MNIEYERSMKSQANLEGYSIIRDNLIWGYGYQNLKI